MNRTLHCVRDCPIDHHQLILWDSFSPSVISIVAPDFVSKHDGLLVVDTGSDGGKMFVERLWQGLGFETSAEL